MKKYQHIADTHSQAHLQLFFSGRNYLWLQKSLQVPAREEFYFFFSPTKRKN